ncbi:MAG: hypothetical protein ACTSR7_20585 [Promethearchaeota archaeon]
MNVLDENESRFIKMFLDFDKNNKIFYVSYYFEEIRMVLKESLIKKARLERDLKIDEFNLTKYTYLIHFE